MQGKCRAGSGCRFAHSNAELQSQPGFDPSEMLNDAITRLSRDLINGKCMPNCVEELHTLPPNKAKATSGSDRIVPETVSSSGTVGGRLQKPPHKQREHMKDIDESSNDGSVGSTQDTDSNGGRMSPTTTASTPMNSGNSSRVLGDEHSECIRLLSELDSVRTKLLRQVHGPKPIPLSEQANAEGNKAKAVFFATRRLQQKEQASTFKKYDVDRDGFLSRGEVAAYAQGEFGFDISKEELDRIFFQLGPRNNRQGVAPRELQVLKAAVDLAQREVLLRNQMREHVASSRHCSPEVPQPSQTLPRCLPPSDADLEKMQPKVMPPATPQGAMQEGSPQPMPCEAPQVMPQVCSPITPGQVAVPRGQLIAVAAPQGNGCTPPGCAPHGQFIAVAVPQGQMVPMVPMFFLTGQVLSVFSCDKGAGVPQKQSCGQLRKTLEEKKTKKKVCVGFSSCLYVF